MSHAGRFMPQVKHKVVACTDANQHQIERNARIKKQQIYEAARREKLMKEYQEKLAEIKKQQEEAEAPSSSTTENAGIEVTPA